MELHSAIHSLLYETTPANPSLHTPCLPFLSLCSQPAQLIRFWMSLEPLLIKGQETVKLFKWKGSYVCYCHNSYIVTFSIMLVCVLPFRILLYRDMWWRFEDVESKLEFIESMKCCISWRYWMAHGYMGKRRMMKAWIYVEYADHETKCTKCTAAGVYAATSPWRCSLTLLITRSMIGHTCQTKCFFIDFKMISLLPLNQIFCQILCLELPIATVYFNAASLQINMWGSRR